MRWSLLLNVFFPASKWWGEHVIRQHFVSHAISSTVLHRQRVARDSTLIIRSTYVTNFLRFGLPAINSLWIMSACVFEMLFSNSECFRRRRNTLRKPNNRCAMMVKCAIVARSMKLFCDFFTGAFQQFFYMARALFTRCRTLRCCSSSIGQERKSEKGITVIKLTGRAFFRCGPLSLHRGTIEHFI